MPKPTNNDDAPRSAPWLNSYADLVTLLWTFFILLFSMAIMSQKKFESGMGSIQSAFGILTGSESPSIVETQNGTAPLDPQLAQVASELARLEAEGQQFEQALQENGLADKVSIEMDGRGLIFRFEDSILFDLGSADVRTEAGPVLMEVGRLIKNVSYPVRIEGHTDSWPISTERFPSNWELSTGRAASVVRFLIENLGFDPNRLEAAGYGEYKPLESNATAEGRQRNRRVDIVLLRPSLAEAEPQPVPGIGP